MNHEIARERWAHVKQIFLDAAGKTGEERRTYLETACSGDTSLQAEVEHLLNQEDRPPPFLHDPSAAIGLAVSDTVRSIAAHSLPERIGPFRILSCIGEGSFAIVYLAEQSRPARQVALKVLKPGMTSRIALHRFQREAEIMAVLRHPSIAHIYELREEESPSGTSYIVMEPIFGEPLTAFAKQRALSVPDCLRLFVQVCDAVQYAHAQGVIHRDLKPSNVLVTENGVPKVLDFGVARLTRTDHGHATLATSAGQLVGTLAYMSPEQADGAMGSVDARSDVYSLGAILYELFAGVPPINVNDQPLHEAIRAITQTVPGRLSIRHPESRGDIETIIAMSLAKDKTLRYQTVSEFSADIERHLRSEPVLARPSSVLYEIGRFARRHHAMVAAAALGFCMLTSVAGWALASRAREHESYVAARDAAGVLIDEVVHFVGPLKGSHDLRERIVSRVRLPIERYAAAHPEDVEMQLYRALLLDVLGDLAVEAGDTDRSLGLRQQASELGASLVLRSPFDAKLLARQAIFLVKVGDQLHLAGDAEGRERCYDEAFALQQRAAAIFPDDPKIADDLIWSDVRRADVRRIRFEYPEGLELARHGGESARALARRQPNEAGPLYALCEALSVESAILADAGEPRAGLGCLEEMVSVGTRVLSLDPNNRGYIARHAVDCCALAVRYLAEQRIDEARLLLADLDRLVTSLLRDEPDTSLTHAVRAIAERLRSDLASYTSQWDQAEAACVAAVEHVRAQIRLEPGTLVVKRDLGRALLKLSDVRTRRGELAEAEQADREAIEWFRNAAQSAAAGPIEFIDYAGALLSCPSSSLRDASTAAQYAEKAIAGARAAPVSYFGVLSQAQALAGDKRAATATLRSALSRLPARASEQRANLERQILVLDDASEGR